MSESPEKQRINVVAGIIWNAEKTCLLISRRPDYLHKGGYWEFPGGKVEPGETEEVALARELDEELGISFTTATLYRVIDHDYPEKLVRLAFYQVCGVAGEVVGRQRQEWRWVPLANLRQYRFPEANLSVMESLVETV